MSPEIQSLLRAARLALLLLVGGLATAETDDWRVSVYFGAGPMAEMQYALAQWELHSRSPAAVTALAGYAGSNVGEGSGGSVCMDTYASLGYAEVAQVTVGAAEFRALARRFLGAFTGPKGERARKSPPGAHFRGCVGLPGGIKGKLFRTLVSENKNWSMDLRPGRGNDPDAFNVVWVYDTEEFPFMQAEQYLQFVGNDTWYEGCLRSAQLKRISFSESCRELAAPNVSFRGCGRHKEKVIPEGQALCERRGSSGHLLPDSQLRWNVSGPLHVGPFTAEAICCANHRYAEAPGFWFRNAEFLAAAQNATNEQPLIFYDSVCGLPVFRAPVGRSTTEWLKESAQHGWPSFRSQELVPENLVLGASGEVQSVCGTHLGHNLPDDKGDRYCIDLVCIAGAEGAKQEPEKDFLAYFGCGHFTHVQHELVLAEVETLGRGKTRAPEISARAAYAGGLLTGHHGEVCFRGEANYAKLGHAEVVRVSCNSSSFKLLAAAFFELCPKGTRRDVEDAGDVYRSLVGLPQGMSSPLAASLRQVAQAAAEGVAGLNALRGAGLRLVAGRGGDQDNAEEGTVYVYDSDVFPAHLAEEYNQFQDDMRQIFRQALPELELEELSVHCPGPETVLPWRQIGGFMLAVGVVLAGAFLCWRLDLPFRWGPSSLQSGSASIEEHYEGLEDEGSELGRYG
ncbi:unnamed protein product [Effrenium voratum]|nr:unnamed protein product [Effrenium voratum]